MIEATTRARAIRRSKIAFWVVGTVVALSTIVVGSAITNLFQAVGIGLIAGAVTGFLVSLCLFVWPAVRVAWHWSAEMTAFTGILAAYLGLTQVMPWWAGLTLLATVLGGPFTIPGVRRRLWSLVMCAVARHRLRVCFAAFIASQRTGMTPLILLARPIPAGERVWIWLRPGLALADLEERLDRLAAGCWAAECRIAPGSRRFSALLRLDIARRNPLTSPVGSPLPDLVPAQSMPPAPEPAGAPVGGLDLPDLPPIADAKRRRPAEPPSDVVVPVEDDLAAWI